MHLPPIPPQKPESPRTVKKEQKTPENTESSEEFAERMSRLEKRAEERHQLAALQAIRKNAATGSRAGMPGASGKQGGSDYASYVRSRLKDAFSSTINYQSRNPEVVVQLRINRYGKVIGYRIQQSSRDKLFETAVARAIDMAAETLTPPPNGEDFEHGYVFRPEGVGKK